MKLRIFFILCLFIFLVQTTVSARTKLVTLPERDEVKVHLDNPNSILVEEIRTITLQKGLNHIDFSWKGVSIEKSSFLIEVIDHKDKVRLIAFSYPPSENAVIAMVYSDVAMEEKIRFAYILSGVNMVQSYMAVSDKKEENLEFKSYVKIKNNSGEDFANAIISVGYGKEYVKSLKNMEAKKMLSEKTVTPVSKKFVWDSAVQPHNPKDEAKTPGIPVFYEIENKTEAGLGKNPLLNGKVRIFQEDSVGTTAFLGEDWGQFTAVGDKMKINVGESRDIVVTRKLMQSKEKNIRKNFYGNKVLFDREEIIEYKLENFKDKPLKITVKDHHEGYWEIINKTHNYEKKDATNFEFEIVIPAKGKETLKYTLIQKNMRP